MIWICLHMLLMEQTPNVYDFGSSTKRSPSTQTKLISESSGRYGPQAEGEYDWNVELDNKTLWTSFPPPLSLVSFLLQFYCSCSTSQSRESYEQCSFYHFAQRGVGDCADTVAVTLLLDLRSFITPPAQFCVAKRHTMTAVR